MTQDEILDKLEDEREKFLEAIDGLSDEEFEEGGVTGEWSVKDILDHLTRWEAEMVKLLWQVSQGQRPTTLHLTQKSVDETNKTWEEQGRQRPLEQVLDDWSAVRKQTSRRVLSFSDKDLNDPKRYAWSGERPLWEWIAGDSFEHEAEHADEIRAWRERKGNPVAPVE